MCGCISITAYMYLSISRKKMVARQLLSLMFFCFESISSYVNVNFFPSDYVNISTIRVGVKYNWSSTQVLQVLVIKYKYKYKYFEFSPIKYSSTSSTDTPSTSTSTKYKYECEHWLAYMYGEYQGGISRELPPCPMITPVQYREIQKGMYTCEY